MPTFLLIILIIVGAPILYWIYVAHVLGAPFLPTPPDAVDKMLALAKIKPGEKVYDLGAGDGRLIIKATQKYRAQAIGFEISPPVFVYAKILNFLKKTPNSARLLFKDSRLVDFSEADVVVIFLLPDPLKDFWKSKLEKELRPGARVLSYAFSIKGWEPITVTAPNPKTNCGPIYLYQI
jgi:SAM-dependent methyltransferase